MPIHPTAVVSGKAELGAEVEVGPFVVIEDDVQVGDRCQIGAGASLLRYTKVGADCQVHRGAVIGGIPQDKKFKGEVTETIIGARNIIREYVTINRGTRGGGGKTAIGDDNLIMSYVHIGHDCLLGDGIVLVSYAALTGHIVIDDRAAVSGMVGIHHFCRIGTMAYVGGMSKVTQDIPPYVLADGNPTRFRGLNLVGLRRNAVSPGAIAALKEAYRVLFTEKDGNLSECIARLKECEEYSFQEVQHLVGFIEERAKNLHGRYQEELRTDKR